MRKFVFVALNAASLFCFMYLLISQKNKFEWMGEMDPDFHHSMFEDASGNSIVAGALAVGAIWLCQIGVAWSARGVWRAVVPLVVSVLAGAVWLVKFN